MSAEFPPPRSGAPVRPGLCRCSRPVSQPTRCVSGRGSSVQFAPSSPTAYVALHTSMETWSAGVAARQPYAWLTELQSAKVRIYITRCPCCAALSWQPAGLTPAPSTPAPGGRCAGRASEGDCRGGMRARERCAAAVRQQGRGNRGQVAAADALPGLSRNQRAG